MSGHLEAYKHSLSIHQAKLPYIAVFILQVVKKKFEKKSLEKNDRGIGLANGKTTVCYSDVNLPIKASLKNMQHEQ